MLENNPTCPSKCRVFGVEEQTVVPTRLPKNKPFDGQEEKESTPKCAQRAGQAS